MNYKIIVLGDICSDRKYSDWFNTDKLDIIFHDVLPLLQNADYVVANLEAPVTERTIKLNKNSVNLKAMPSDISLLYKAGIKAVSLANNHILDYKTEGLDDTLRLLSSCNIGYYGISGYCDLSFPYIVSYADVKIGFLSFAEREFNCAADYGKGACLWDSIDSLALIKKSKSLCDYLIVQYHGGIEHYIYPSPELQKKCRAMVEAGADYVTCQHSHIIGTFERWKGAEILYGQGNTLFGYKRDDKLNSWNYGLISCISLSTNKGFIESKIEYVPIEATTEGIKICDSKKKEGIINSLNQESKYIQNEEIIQSKWKDFCKKQSPTYLPMQYGWSVNFIRLNKLFKGLLFKLLVSSNKQRNTMNLLRCDAHREVLQTILETNCYEDQR